MCIDRKFQFIRRAVLGLALTCALAGQASATVYSPGSVSNLTGYLSGVSVTAFAGSLAGGYKVTSLDYEAGDKIYFYQNSQSPALFYNKQVSTQAGTWAEVAEISSAYFYDATRGDTLGINDRNQVKAFLLNQDWTTKNGVSLTSGTLILGLNDKGGGPDSDYDDFIIAVSKTKPAQTPIPAAAWLLGSGIAGLAGFRRFASRGSDAE